MFWNKKKEKRYSRKTVIILEVIFAVLAILIGLGIKYLITNQKTDTINLSDQVVNNITFSGFNISFSKSGSKITVNLINYTKEPIKFKSVEMKMYAKNNTQVASVSYGDGENEIELGPNQETLIESTTEVNLSNVTFIEYEVK